jgi:hypothetical protein
MALYPPIIDKSVTAFTGDDYEVKLASPIVDYDELEVRVLDPITNITKLRDTSGGIINTQTFSKGVLKTVKPFGKNMIASNMEGEYEVLLWGAENKKECPGYHLFLQPGTYRATV